MLPGFRFLFAAIVISTSLIVFGLGAVALLRASHYQIATVTAREFRPDPVFAQNIDPELPTLSLLRVDAASLEPARTPEAALDLPNPTGAQPTEPATADPPTVEGPETAAPGEVSGPVATRDSEISDISDHGRNPPMPPAPPQSVEPSIVAAAPDTSPHQAETPSTPGVTETREPPVTPATAERPVLAEPAPLLASSADATDVTGNTMPLSNDAAPEAVDEVAAIVDPPIPVAHPVAANKMTALAPAASERVRSIAKPLKASIRRSVKKRRVAIRSRAFRPAATSPPIGAPFGSPFGS